MKRFISVFILAVLFLGTVQAQIFVVDKTFTGTVGGTQYVRLAVSAGDSVTNINLGFTGNIGGISYATSPLYPDSVALIGYVTSDSTSWITIRTKILWPGASVWTSTKWDTVGSATAAAVTYQKTITASYYNAARFGAFGISFVANSTGNAAVASHASKFYWFLRCFYKIPR